MYKKTFYSMLSCVLMCTFAGTAAYAKTQTEEREENCEKCKWFRCLSQEIDKVIPCGEVHVIDSVPALVDQPGKWCVKEDLVYTGSGHAITVTASNVTLNFNNHSLTLTNPGAQGIFAENISELTIQNDIIQASAVSANPSSVAIQLIGCEKVTLDAIFTANTYFGLYAVECNDVFVSDSHFKDHIGGGGTLDLLSAAIRSDATDALVVDNSVFTGAGSGAFQGNGSAQIILRDASSACRISSCEFSDVEGSILIIQAYDVLIEDCIMQTAPTEPNFNARFQPAVQLGTQTAPFLGEAVNITMRGCLLRGNLAFGPTCLPVVTNPATFPCTPVSGIAQFGLTASRGRNILIEECDFGDFSAGQTAAGPFIIRMAGTSTAMILHDITIRSCTIKGNLEAFPSVSGSTSSGIVIADLANCVIEGCQISEVRFGMQCGSRTRNVWIKENAITNTSSSGIIFGSDAKDTNIENNTFIAITVDQTSIQAISQTANTSLNGLTIQGNTMTGENADFGIHVDNADGAIIRGNTINNRGVGIVIGASTTHRFVTNTVVQENTVNLCTFAGIYLAGDNTVVQDNICSYNGQDPESFAPHGIVVSGCSKTDVIRNSCIKNTGAGIWIGDNSTRTFLEANTATHNGVWGIIDNDNVNQVTALENIACDNDIANCVNIPLQQQPGSNTFIAGANLCCQDPDMQKAVSSKKLSTSRQQKAVEKYWEPSSAEVK